MMPSEQRPKVTVLTPTYNRRSLLGRLYESLKQQRFRDFEWLVIDDGSTDATHAQLEQWAREAPFPIRCRRQENQGMIAAWNRGVEEARGEYCAVIGSDDWYLPGALECLVRHWSMIPRDRRHDFANIEGLAVRPGGRVIGRRFPRDVLDSDNFDREVVHGVTGDKIGMYRTAVLREFRFPEELGREQPEGIVFNRIAKRYRSRFVNDVIACVDYQDDGLSRRDRMIYIRNPEARLVHNREVLLMDRPLPVRVLIKTCSNYVRFALRHSARLEREVMHTQRFVVWLLAVPLGAGLALHDRMSLRRASG